MNTPTHLLLLRQGARSIRSATKSAASSIIVPTVSCVANATATASSSSSSSSSSSCSVRCLATEAKNTPAAAAPAAGSASARTTIRPHSIQVGPTQLNRNQEHYRSTLASDLLYMTFDSSLNLTPSQSASEELSPVQETTPISNADREDRLRKWDENDPYTIHRPQRPSRGNRRLQPLTKPLSTTNTLVDLPRLDKIIITSFCKEAIVNKHALIPLFAQMRAITGLSVAGSLADPSSTSSSSSSSSESKRGTIQVIRAKSGVASFKLRPGMPVGVKATLPGPIAHEFLEVLTTFVLPRLRSFNGFPLPSSSQPSASPAATSGVVSLGLGPEAISLFPQIEINLDQYPNRPLGFQVDCITNQRGKKATEKARLLLSGLGVPFVRRGDM